MNTPKRDFPRRFPIFRRAGGFPARLWGLLAVIMVTAFPAISFAGSSPLCPREKEWGAYLSNGYRDGVPWGGFHVTIAGFSKVHACTKGMSNALEKAWALVHKSEPFDFAKDAKAISGPKEIGKGSDKGYYWVTFQSETLDRLARVLVRDYQFQAAKMKGPEFAKTSWHVSLDTTDPKEAARRWAAISGKAWRLYKIRFPDEKSCREIDQNGEGCVEDGYWFEVNGQRGGGAD